MVRNPLTYVMIVTICAIGFWLHAAKDSGGGQTTTPTGTVKLFKAATDPELKELAAGNNAFAWDLYTTLAKDEKGNLFFSPFSIRSALAMTYVGAQADTARQMKETLHFTQDDKRLHAAFKGTTKCLDTDGELSHTLRIANALWGQAGYSFLQPFLDVNATYYGSGLHTVDFQGAPEKARQTINLWVEDKTNKKIKDLIPPRAMNTQTKLVLVNAVYFLGFWDTEFDKTLTREAPFHVAKDKVVNVQMMGHRTHNVKVEPRFRYVANKDFQALELPYKGDAVSMIVLLPKDKLGLAALEASLSVAGLAKHLADLDRAPKREVRVYLPKWKMTWGTKDLTPYLQSLGMTDAFALDKADLSGINGAKPPSLASLYIGAVFHQAFVDVNEEGTVAAAATAVMTLDEGKPSLPPAFLADHPFLFLIRDNVTGSILFMGRVIQPNP